MPRPRKWRRVCCLPQSTNFGPLDDDNSEKQIIIMTVDEFESIRLIDLEGLNQEACAKHMAVARTTAQAIYNSARFKLAKCLIQGKVLQIEGGNFILCEGFKEGCGCIHCHKNANNKINTLGDEENE